MSDIKTTRFTELGSLVKEYKLSSKRVWQLIFLTGISAGMALGCLLPAIFETNESMATRTGISILGLLVSTPMFVGIYQLFRLGGVSLSLYEHGLVFRRRGRDFTTTWDEIDSYLQESTCRITKKNGEVIEFGMNIDGIDEVVEEIQKQTSRRLLPQIKTAIMSGSSVQFKGLKPFGNNPLGKILNNFMFAFSGFSVDSQGVSMIDGGNRMAWKDVRAYGVSQEKMGRIPVDVFVIQDGKARFRTRFGLLSNAHILLVLCGEMTGLHQKDGG